MTLEQIKNEVANEHGFNNLLWNEKENQFINEVAKRYANACVKASLEKAANEAKMGTHPEGTSIVINKSSITNPDNIVLL